MLRVLAISTLLACAIVFAQTKPDNDDRIYDQVRQKLVADRDVRGGGLEVDVKDGVVTLRGALREEKQKQKAEKIAKKVKGVNKVVNEISVKPAAP
jgi:osmotically-inducible protein OsmY